MQNLSCFSILLSLQHSKQDNLKTLHKGARLRVQNFRVQIQVDSRGQNFRVQIQFVSRVQNFRVQRQDQGCRILVCKYKYFKVAEF